MGYLYSALLKLVRDSAINNPPLLKQPISNIFQLIVFYCLFDKIKDDKPDVTITATYSHNKRRIKQVNR